MCFFKSHNKRPLLNTCILCGVVIPPNDDLCGDCEREAFMLSVISLTDNDLWEDIQDGELDFD